MTDARAIIGTTGEFRTSPIIGTYRVVYRIYDAAHTIWVLSIRLRGDVYGVR